MKLKKIVLNLIIIAAEVLAVRFAWEVYFDMIDLNKGIVLLLASCIATILLIIKSRSKGYRWIRPGLWKTTALVGVILVILAFLGLNVITMGCSNIQEAKDKMTTWVAPESPPPSLIPIPEEEKPIIVEEPKSGRVTPPKVTSIYKSLYGNPPKPPNLKVDIFVQLASTKDCEGKFWYITLRADNENFGTKEVFWTSGLQETNAVWNIPSSSEAFSKLQLNIPEDEILQVSILSEQEIEEAKQAVEKAKKEAEEQKLAEEQKVKEEITRQEKLRQEELGIERQTFDLINQEREKEGLRPTTWDDKLYQLSKAHTEDMANKGELFHTSTGAAYGENAWGASWGGISKKDLPNRIVSSWMSSPLHRAWILHTPLRTSVVSIVDDSRGQYASWTFWTKEAGSGPPLVKKAYDIWMRETGGKTPWLTWLYDIKGYPNNIDWLIPPEETTAEKPTTSNRPPDGSYVCRELIVSQLILQGDTLDLVTLNTNFRKKFKIEYLDSTTARLTDSQGQTDICYLEYKKDFQCILFSLNGNPAYISEYYRE